MVDDRLTFKHTPDPNRGDLWAIKPLGENAKKERERIRKEINKRVGKNGNIYVRRRK